MLARKPPVHLGQVFDLAAFAGVHEQRGTLDFATAAFVKLAEGGYESYWKIVYAVEAEIFKGVEYRAFARTGKAGENHQLASVAFWGSAAAGHGVGR
jgi:hypothetical protein